MTRHTLTSGINTIGANCFVSYGINHVNAIQPDLCAVCYSCYMCREAFGVLWETGAGEEDLKDYLVKNEWLKPNG